MLENSELPLNASENGSSIGESPSSLSQTTEENSSFRTPWNESYFIERCPATPKDPTSIATVSGCPSTPEIALFEPSSNIYESPSLSTSSGPPATLATTGASGIVPATPQPMSVPPKGDDDVPMGLLSFWSAKDVGVAFNLSGWTVAEEIKLLTRVANGSIPDVKVSDRMAAAKQLRGLSKDVLRLHGHLVDQTSTFTTTNDRGEGCRVTTVGAKLFKKATSESALALASALGRPDPPPPLNYEGLPRNE